MSIDAEFRIAALGAGANKLGAFRGFIAMTIKPHGGFQHQKNVKTFLLDPGNHLRDLFRFSQRAVNGLSQLFH